jgi:hypothetical protein
MTLIGKQRIVIGMYDGFGMDYMAASRCRRSALWRSMVFLNG